MDLERQENKIACIFITSKIRWLFIIRLERIFPSAHITSAGYSQDTSVPRRPVWEPLLGRFASDCPQFHAYHVGLRHL